jgi:hypothetical protein
MTFQELIQNTDVGHGRRINILPKLFFIKQKNSIYLIKGRRFFFFKKRRKESLMDHPYPEHPFSHPELGRSLGFKNTRPENLLLFKCHIRGRSQNVKSSSWNYAVKSPLKRD